METTSWPWRPGLRGNHERYYKSQNVTTSFEAGKISVIALKQLSLSVGTGEFVSALSTPRRLKILLDVDLPRPRTPDMLVDSRFLTLKRACMAMVREEILGSLSGRPRVGKTAPGGSFLAETADAV